MKKTDKSRKTGNILIAVGAILIASAMVIVFYNLFASKNAEKKSEDILLKMDIPTTDEARTPDYELSPDVGMPEIEIDGVFCIAVVEIPKLGIKLPVLSECTKQNLKIAPCRYTGSAYTDDLVIAGHNYLYHFRNIGNLMQGDSVIITDMDGNKFNYVVSATDVLQPTDVEDMTKGEWPLTLFTCDYSGQTRITIRCDRLNETVSTETVTASDYQQ